MKSEAQFFQLMPTKPAYFVTFVTWDRLELNPDARQIVLDACLFFNGKRYQIFAVVIMPDHIHILIEPFAKTELEDWSIGKILHSIKGYSSTEIPKVMTHIGKLWQDGRHEDFIKNRKHFFQTWEYIKQNPVKAGLSVSPEEYPFFWEARTSNINGGK